MFTIGEPSAEKPGVSGWVCRRDADQSESKLPGSITDGLGRGRRGQFALWPRVERFRRVLFMHTLQDLSIKLFHRLGRRRGFG